MNSLKTKRNLSRTNSHIKICESQDADPHTSTHLPSPPCSQVTLPQHPWWRSPRRPKKYIHMISCRHLHETRLSDSATRSIPIFQQPQLDHHPRPDSCPCDRLAINKQERIAAGCMAMVSSFADRFPADCHLSFSLTQLRPVTTATVPTHCVSVDSRQPVPACSAPPGTVPVH